MNSERHTSMLVIACCAVVASTLLCLGGCNTMEGAGEDLEEAGESIEDAAD